MIQAGTLRLVLEMIITLKCLTELIILPNMKGTLITTCDSATPYLQSTTYFVHGILESRLLWNLSVIYIFLFEVILVQAYRFSLIDSSIVNMFGVYWGGNFLH